MKWEFEQDLRLKERVKGGLRASGAWDWGDEITQALWDPWSHSECEWLQPSGWAGWLSPGMCVAVPSLPAQAAEREAPEGGRQIQELAHHCVS